ncbi:MAG: DUF3667 domain-containing protein [Lewinellaceae bacterium]|nr:DUF3667 domain-containing protein [Saprospiraceae bacterium]MCB9337512.1 DUF3667 domain-containing protein [Lewinellaceae bacterium]
MQENIAENCRNCHHPLPEGAKYCPACGQKNTDGRLTFREMAVEFVDTLFNLDNRIFSTLGAMAIPGKLTQSYFEGKHIRYYHPVRLFIVSAGIFTALTTFKIGQLGLNDLKIGIDERKEEYQKLQQQKLLDSLTCHVSESFNNQEVDAALDTLKVRFKKINSPPGYDLNINFMNGEMQVDTLNKNKKPAIEQSDSLVVNNFFRFGGKDIKVAIADLLNLDEEQLLDKYGVKGWKNRLMFRQYVRLKKGGSRFFIYFIGNIIWMMLIMMPMLAIVLKLLYIRRKFFYYEHLVFSFHTHAFMFLFFALIMALGNVLPDVVGAVMFLFSAVYLFLAMKRFYGQGIFKTFIKFSLANLLYLLIVTLAGTLTLMASAVFF